MAKILRNSVERMKMQKNIEIAKDLNNKLQQATLIAERIFDGQKISKNFIRIAKTDLTAANRLLTKLEEGSK